MNVIGVEKRYVNGRELGEYEKHCGQHNVFVFRIKILDDILWRSKLEQQVSKTGFDPYTLVPAPSREFR